MIGMAGGPTICPTLLYEDAQAAIAQLKDAFGFTVAGVYEAEDGAVLHAELTHGGGTVMLGSKGGEGAFVQAMKGAGPVGVYVAVEDVDAHCARARQAGAEILTEPTDQDYGARDYMARDLEGNVWSFGTYIPGQADA
ncbi:VOC family protein [Streptomyces sp. NPDC054796]